MPAKGEIFLKHSLKLAENRVFFFSQAFFSLCRFTSLRKREEEKIDISIPRFPKKKLCLCVSPGS